ncbi:MAG: Asp23/Gls24 family envelope stress response protein [Gaiellaceae bacterium]
MSLVLPEPGGTITVTPPALAGLVVQAAEAVDGVQVRRGRRHLDIDIALGEARVRLELTARYGLVLPEVARDVQERVADALVTMCAVRIGSVDISVEEVE